jgi:hypothetical protein
MLFPSLLPLLHHLPLPAVVVLVAARLAALVAALISHPITTRVHACDESVMNFWINCVHLLQ